MFRWSSVISGLRSEINGYQEVQSSAYWLTGHHLALADWSRLDWADWSLSFHDPRLLHHGLVLALTRRFNSVLTFCTKCSFSDSDTTTPWPIFLKCDGLRPNWCLTTTSSCLWTPPCLHLNKCTPVADSSEALKSSPHLKWIRAPQQSGTRGTPSSAAEQHFSFSFSTFKSFTLFYDKLLVNVNNLGYYPKFSRHVILTYVNLLEQRFSDSLMAPLSFDPHTLMISIYCFCEILFLFSHINTILSCLFLSAFHWNPLSKLSLTRASVVSVTLLCLETFKVLPSISNVSYLQTYFNDTGRKVFTRLFYLTACYVSVW